MRSTAFAEALQLSALLLVLFNCDFWECSLPNWAAAANEIPRLADVASRFEPLAFDDAYTVIWGNPAVSEDGLSVDLTLDKHSGGAGFISLDNYMYGLYSASIKFPANYTAGIVLAFYASNDGNFHDELDFEFLGNNVKGKPWRIQTNVYGNGSVSRGREERLDFWFDPTAAHHTYSILWNHKHIVFMVDGIPIREMIKTEDVAMDYPSKPMALYATIWDASSWATDGGKYPVDYNYAPFRASFKNLKLEGCEANPIPEEYDIDACIPTVTTSSSHTPLFDHHGPKKFDYTIGNPIVTSHDLFSLSPTQRTALEWVRTNHMYYSYCDDRARYEHPLPECSYNPTTSNNKKQKRRRPKTKRGTFDHPASKINGKKEPH